MLDIITLKSIALTLGIAKHTSSYAYIVISLLTYSTTEPANPPSRPLFFTLKKALSWHRYLKNY
jgi:hypothetical protein